MRKNGARLISLKQYKLTDLFLFAAILLVFELILHFAFIAFNGDFTFSPMFPIVLLVMARWGWVSVFYAVGDGLLYCLLNMGAGFDNSLFVVYCIGNAFIALALIYIKLVGKQKVTGKWYFSLLLVFIAWVCVILGRALVAVCFGYSFVGALFSQLSGLLSLGVAVIVILVMRRFDGMVEDQIAFLKRLDKERKEKMRRDEFGDEMIDIDAEALDILNKSNDLY